MTDTQIINMFFARSDKALSAAGKKYGRYCFTVAYNILKNIEDSDECVNDTMLFAWNSIPPQRPCSLSAYLGKLTRNIALNRYKSLHAKKRGGGRVELVLSELSECIPDKRDTEKAFDDACLTNAVERYLRSVPETKRNIFIRRYFYMYSVKDIAKAYTYSESKVTSLLFRMRAELKSYLEKEGINI